MPGSAGSGSSSGAPPKYRMVYTPPRVSCISHNSSRIGVVDHISIHGSSSNSTNSSSSNSSTVLILHRRSRLPPGCHNSFPPATSHASTMGRWATLLENDTCPCKATHRELRHPWSTSGGAIKKVLHHGLTVPTTPPWRRFPR
jgi:hypothetical protein